MMRDFRINLIFEGSSEIMRLFIAREALDRHLQAAGDLVNPKAPVGKRLAALPGMLAFYAVWYPTRWLGWGRFPRFSEFGALAGHARFVDRSCRRLARSIFHAMVRYGPGLERRQNVLFRLVDVGADLFAMSAAISRADRLRRDASGNAESASDLADLFCRMTRRRVRGSLRAVGRNDDARSVATARGILAGRFEWMEHDLVDANASERPAGREQTRTPEPSPVSR